MQRKKQKTYGNYGELIAEATGGFLLSYAEYGDYSGDYIAIIEKNKDLHIYKGVYGSCSGCDWLDMHTEYNEDTEPEFVDDSEDDIKEYMKECPVFLELPKEAIPETVEELFSLLPANTRVDYDEEYGVKMEEILKQLQNPQFNNLEYLEHKYDKKNETR